MTKKISDLYLQIEELRVQVERLQLASSICPITGLVCENCTFEYAECDTKIQHLRDIAPTLDAAKVDKYRSKLMDQIPNQVGVLL